MSVHKSRDIQNCIWNQPRYAICVVLTSRLYYKVMQIDSLWSDMANNLQLQSFLWRLMNCGSRITGQLRQPTSTPGQLPGTSNGVCVCLNITAPGIPLTDKLYVFSYDYKKDNPIIEYGRKCNANWNIKHFCKLNIFSVIPVRTGSSLQKI